MSDEKKLSDRVRPNIEAAPWVCDEIVALEQRLAAAETILWDTLDVMPGDSIGKEQVIRYLGRVVKENVHD